MQSKKQYQNQKKYNWKVIVSIICNKYNQKGPFRDPNMLFLIHISVDDLQNKLIYQFPVNSELVL